MTVELELQTTRGEKVLALVLAAFLLIGGIWAYDRIGSAYPDPPTPTAADRAAIERLDTARQTLSAASVQADERRRELELARERYRTALDAGENAAALERAYRLAERAYAAAQAAVDAARVRVESARPAAAAAFVRQSEAAAGAARNHARTTFALRLTLLLALLAVSSWSFSRLRSSRYLPLGSALLGAATALAFVLAGDYVTDYVEWRDLGPLALSAAGATLTVATFWGLQRQLARRLPLRRVRRGECPACGHPIRGTRRCEGCGGETVRACATCGSERRVGALHCGACGAAG